MEEAHYEDSTEVAKARAEESGDFQVIVGDDLHLLLDLDTASDERHFERYVTSIHALGIKVISREEWTSKGGGMHVLLRMETPIRERIAIQALLGSDRKREFLAMAGVITREAEYPVMLFKPRRKGSGSVSN